MKEQEKPKTKKRITLCELKKKIEKRKSEMIDESTETNKSMTIQTTREQDEFKPVLLKNFRPRIGTLYTCEVQFRGDDKKTSCLFMRIREENLNHWNLVFTQENWAKIETYSCFSLFKKLPIGLCYMLKSNDPDKSILQNNLDHYIIHAVFTDGLRIMMASHAALYNNRCYADCGLMEMSPRERITITGYASSKGLAE